MCQFVQVARGLWASPLDLGVILVMGSICTRGEDMVVSNYIPSKILIGEWLTFCFRVMIFCLFVCLSIFDLLYIVYFLPIIYCLFFTYYILSIFYISVQCFFTLSLKRIYITLEARKLCYSDQIR